MTSARAVRLAGLLGALGVGLGAFGAHGLKATLAANGTTEIWHTAVFYHFVHTLALLLLAQRPRVPKGPVIAFLAGILIFSGSLYALALTNIKWLGAITPLGGVSFIVGWVWLMARPGVSEDSN